MRGRVLKRADTDVTCGDADEHRAGQHRLPPDAFAGRHHCQGPGRWDPKRVHRLADQELAQHRPDGGFAVAAPRERRPARTLQVHVTTASMDVEHLAQEKRPTIAQTRRIATELMPGICLCGR